MTQSHPKSSGDVDGLNMNATIVKYGHDCTMIAPRPGMYGQVACSGHSTCTEFDFHVASHCLVSHLWFERHKHVLECREQPARTSLHCGTYVYTLSHFAAWRNEHVTQRSTTTSRNCARLVVLQTTNDRQSRSQSCSVHFSLLSSTWQTIPR